jgi:hypothetical protein
MTLTGLSLKDGSVLSKTKLPEWLEHSPVTVENSLAAIMVNGIITVMNEKSGKKESTIETGQTIVASLPYNGALYCVTSGTKFIDKALNKNVKGRIFALDFSNPSDIKEMFSLSKESFGEPRGTINISGRYLYYYDAFYSMNCVDIIDRRYLYEANANRCWEMDMFPYDRGIIYCHSAHDIYYLVDKARELPGDLLADSGSPEPKAPHPAATTGDRN